LDCRAEQEGRGLGILIDEQQTDSSERTPEQLDAMVQLLHDSIDAGGLGFSTTLSYTHSDGDGAGDGGHDLVLKDLRAHLPKLEKRIKQLGAPGFFLEVEPHLKGGGQFGGFSGPDGLGVAVRSLCRLLDYVQIGYQLRTFDDIRALRGF